MINGKECVYLHPRKCIQYCRYGNDRQQGCNGPCEFFHPNLCTNSVRFKQCFKPNCTYAHLLGTKRRQPQPQTYPTEARYGYDYGEIYRGPSGTSRRNQNSPPNISRRPIIDGMTGRYLQDRQQRNYQRDDYRYDETNFPHLHNRDDSKIDQLSSSIKEMHTYFLNNIASERVQNSNCQIPQSRSLPLNTSFDPHTQNRLVQNSESKNYQRQNQLYPAN